MNMPNLNFVSPDKNPAKKLARALFDFLSPKSGECVFENTYAIAPTKNAARDIQFEFSKIVAQNSGGTVFGISFVTAEVFINLCIPQDAPALSDNLETSLAMQGALSQINPQEFPTIFGEAKTSLSDAQLSALSKRILKLRSLCAESSKTISQVCDIMEGEIFCDILKFRELAAIEGLFLKNIAQLGKICPSDAAILAAKNPSKKLAGAKIFALCLPDISELFVELIATLAEKNAAQTEIFCMSQSREGFDNFGRPNCNFWCDKTIEISNSQIETFADCRTQAKAIANFAQKLSKPSEELAISCAGGESELAVISELKNAGLDAFSPAGQKLSQGSVFVFLRLLKNYFDDPSFFNFCALVRTEQILNFLKTDFDCEFVKSTLDKFLGLKLAQNLKSAIDLANRDSKERKLFEALARLLQSNPDSLSNIEYILNTVYRDFETQDPIAVDALASIFNTIQNYKICAKKFGTQTESQTLSNILEFADARVFNQSRQSGQIYIKNWLEIFWTNEEKIIAADFNEGKVPEKEPSDAFMTDSLRRKLNIRDSHFRHARDAYLAQTLISKRRSDILFFVPKTDFNKDDQRPSRLLLQVPKSELPERAKLLFGEALTPKSSVHFEKLWDISIPKIPLPTYLGATDFKAYLECPFEFYLKKFMRLETFDAFKNEADARDVGTIMHAVLQNLKDFESEDDGEIFAFLSQKLDLEFDKAFGFSPPASAKFQKHFLRQRLRNASVLESLHRRAGWRTIATEVDYTNLEIGKFKVKARIDRIDEDARGNLMVIDYKTIDNPYLRAGVSPAEAAHLKRQKKDAPNNYDWKDLQLPLYTESVARKFGKENVWCAYFLMAASVEDSSFDVWKIDLKARQSALLKAKEIAEKIAAYKFEPAENTKVAKHFEGYFDFAQNLSEFVRYER